MEGTSGKYVYEFSVGMTCEGCSNAIKRILGAEKGRLLMLLTHLVIENIVTDVPNKKLTVVGPDGMDTLVLEKLNKWSTANKKEMSFVIRNEITVVA